MRRMLCFLILLPSLALGSEVYFSPNGGVRDQIIKRINNSKSFIDLAMYSLTSGDIAEALGNASKRGVKIRVVRDSIQSENKNDENAYLKQNGIQVGLRSGKGRGIMHNKFAVFDGKELFMGSYNWTDSAEKDNYENAVFTDEAAVVQAYMKEFEVLWKAPPKTISPTEKANYRRKSLN